VLYPHNPYSLGRIAKETVARYLREAEIAEWTRVSSRRRQSWLSDQIRKGLQNWSHALTIIGQRKDHIGTRSV
jgi:hypothetical protein